MTASFDDFVVTPAATIRDAMLALERGAREIVLVVDEQRRLIALATDGDLRRALLGGATLDDPLAQFARRDFTAVSESAGRVEVLDLITARGIGQIPILDGEGRLVGLHLMREILGGRERPNWAVVMAGGRGRRLAPFTDDVPKPMLRVAGRPILERIVLHLVSSGIRQIFLSINYLGHVISDHFGDGERFGCRIRYLREEQPLGTGGSLTLLPERPRSPLLVMNGDLVTEANLGALIDHHERSGLRATIGIRRYLHTIPFGCVELEGDRIVRLEEKPTISHLVNAGIYVLDPSLLERIPPGQPYPITALFEDCLARGEGVDGFEIEDDWIDVGHRGQLVRARGDEP